MNIFEAIGQAEADDWKDACYWLFWTVFGMMPLWLLFLPLISFSKPVSLDVFAGKGEFALYSAGILSGAIYMVTKEIKPSFVFRDDVDARSRSLLDRLEIHFPSHRSLITLSVLLVVVSAAVFMMTTLAGLFSSLSPSLSINQSFVNWFTFIIFLVSTVLSFLITVVDNASMQEQDFKRILQQDIVSLEEAFDELNKVD